jgi:hypothetical protein
MSLQLGAQLFVLTAYEKPDGNIACSKYDPEPYYYSDQQIADNFTDFKLSHVVEMLSSTWNLIGKRAFGRSGPIMQKINMVSVSHFSMLQAIYAFTDDEGELQQVGEDGDDGADANPSFKKDPVVEIPMHEDFGWPLIPRKGDNTLQKSKSVIRAYVTSTYRKSTFFAFFFAYKLIIFQVNLRTTMQQRCHGPPFPLMSTLNTFLLSPFRRGYFCGTLLSFNWSKFGNFGGIGPKDKKMILRDLSS